MSKPDVAERHPRTLIDMFYQIETIESSGDGLTWVPLKTRMIRHEGKFISFHKDFRDLVNHKLRVFTDEQSFAYAQPAPAEALAKALSKIWDMPLRVMKVQKIRIQTPQGKVILPQGGV